uniref:GON-4-like protein n=1 Tax=Varanus komodoensis TaxID=61221 RepID=A0A8D2J9P0_VARKO
METTSSAPAGDLGDADGELVKGAAIPSRDAPQKAWQESAEAPSRGGKTFPKAGSDLCPQQAEECRDAKCSPSAKLFVDKIEQHLDCAAGLLPKMEAEWEVADDPQNAKAPKPLLSAEVLHELKEEAEETGLFIPVEEREEGGKRKRRKATKRKREGKCQEEEEEGPLACDLKLDDTLDRTLEDGAKQHNLTAVNVRNILHEVITNEHVVAMMKAAISETEDIPMFVNIGGPFSSLSSIIPPFCLVLITAFLLSLPQPPQFVDIPLEEDDSSDEEYQPEEEEEDETAEESLMESDVESTSSSPRGAKRSRTRRSPDMIETDEEGAALLEVEKASPPPLQRHISAEVVPMGPPPPPKPKQSKDSSFMEKLHAVDEELASSPVCMDAYQPLEDSLIAFRTRSKRPLKDVPLGQLEAELQAPDITPDMYDPNTADDEDWKRWLGGLMHGDVENEDEADDDDDPEYNFLEDLDEPDTEDFRNDRAVRITKKEVNELMEELFETFQDEMGFPNVEDEGPEDDDSTAEARPNFNTPQVLRFEEPLANLLNEQHRTVKEQLEQLRMKKSAAKLPLEAEKAKPHNEKPIQALMLDAGQRKRLQQQMQQHVQLLTQVHLLSSSNPSLTAEADTTRLFLTELDTFAQSATLLRQPLGHKFQTLFQPCNLREALQLLQDFHSHVKIEWSPRKAVKKNGRALSDFACLPKQVAWILATRRVFMYPELLPTCSLKAKTPRDKIFFTKGEDNLLALGLKHFDGTEFPKPLISKYLLTTKTAHQLTVRIKNLNMNRVPDNILKYYKSTKQLPVLSKLCEEIQPGEGRPPVEQEEHCLPFWLKASLPAIQQEMLQPAAREAPKVPGAEPAEPVSKEKYPLHVPEGLQLILRPLNSRFCRKAWRRPRPAAAKPLPVRPGLCLPPSSSHHFLKMAAKQPQPEVPPSRVAGRVPRLIQPAPALTQPLPGVQHLSLQPAVRSGAGLELQGVLSAPQASPRPCVAASVPPSLVSPLPLAFQPKMILPALPTSRVRKPGGPRGYQKKKAARAAPLLKAAPLLQPAPVIFTVPAGAVKVVGLAGGCNVLQPLAAAPAGRPAQPIPITTLLVNPAPFPCPLSQPVANPPAPALVVAPSSAGSPAPAATKDSESGSQPAGGEAAALVQAEPATEPQESSSSAAAPGQEDCEAPVQAYVEMAGESVVELPAPGPFSPLAELGEMAKAEFEGPSGASPEAAPVEPGSVGSQGKEGLMLDLGQELDVEPAPACADGQGETRSKQDSRERVATGQEPPGQASQSAPAAADEGGASPGNAVRSRAVEPKSGGLAANPDDLPGSSSCAGEPLASQEAAAEKEGPEDEEEEDFDDYIQDEEDEEMSSASEESVLSVPELQETMEKLTWLASERRLSQEGDSEEENSQEENSEPEEEEEEEEEGESLETVQKEDEVTDEVAGPGDRPASSLALPCAPPEADPSGTPAGENPKAPGKSRGAHRARAKRGRARASKDTSKLLLLYDEDILERDPLREQKDLAFAQAYLSRVRDASRHVPGKYEEFLRIIYEYESSAQRQTAVDLYARLRVVLREWPQLLADFAAFLLPEQALECGLFEEQQAFEKSRKFLRQLEICFAENPSHHQKIIKVLQSCAECVPQEIIELKTQMWQLLKGHDHLQDEFSVFFDHLRPSASRLGDFEEINWTEEKDYEFDGFEEVSLPDVEEEEDPPKIHAASKNKRRKELGGQNADKEPEWGEAPKEGCCFCHEGGGDLRMKRSKRRNCSHCSSKVSGGRGCKSAPEALGLGCAAFSFRSPFPSSAFAGPRVEGKPPVGKEAPVEGGAPPTAKATEACSLPVPPCPKKPAEPPRLCPQSATPQPHRGLPPKPHRPKSSSCSLVVGESGGGLGPRSGDALLPEGPADAECGAGGPGLSPALSQGRLPTCPVPSASAEAPAQPHLTDDEADGAASVGHAPKGKELPGPHSKELALKAAERNGGPQPPAEASGPCRLQALAVDPKARAEAPAASDCSPEPGGGKRAGPPRGEEPPPRAVEATVCAKNIKVSSTGEKVVLWTREADRVILTACQERGANPDTFSAISQQLHNKTPEEVAHRFRELMALFHTACNVSSEDEEDGMSTSNTDQLSDKEPVLSEEEREEHGF